MGESFGEEQGKEQHRAEEELVHHNHRGAVMLRQGLGEGNLAYLGDDGDEQDADAQPEQRSRGGAGIGDQPQAGQGDEHAQDVELAEVLLENEQAGRHGKERIGGDDERGDGRGFREVQAVGLGDKVDERHTQGQQAELEDVLLAHTHLLLGDDIDDKQQHAGHQDAHRHKEFHGDIEFQQPVGPNIGHGPQHHREHGCQIRTKSLVHVTNINKIRQNC